MRGFSTWIVGGVSLVLIGVLGGVIITTSSNLAPVSSAQEVRSGGLNVSGVATAAFGESPFVAVADEVMPAVVSVDTRRTIRRGVDPFNDMFRRFFGDAPDEDSEPRYREYEVPGSASGFIFDRSGYILTNNHVVAGADEITVTLHDGREFSAVVVGEDPSTDIAVIKIEGNDLPFVRLGDSDKIRVGSWAIAIGNPLDLEGTVTVGVVSAVGRVDLRISGGAPIYQDFIQTDASINFGNSGGPLCNVKGEVIGINAATNAAAEGIGFAIPINLASEVADALMAEGKVVRGYLGIVPQDITNDLAEATGIESTDGVLVASVEPGTPAADAGLLAGDVVKSFAGVAIDGAAQFRRVVADVEPGKRVEVEIIRAGRTKTLTAKLAERPGEETVSIEEPVAEETWFGLDVVDLDDPAARQLGIEIDHGALIIGVERGSAGDRAGLEAGDIVVRIGNTDIKDVKEYREAMAKYEGVEKALALMVQRGAHTYFVAVKPG
ncbi:Do family serine endopeptidase [bacterium]|nr:Do family serine endopeptidase [bacterium]